jgi:hypothetical protein
MADTSSNVSGATPERLSQRLGHDDPTGEIVARLGGIGLPLQCHRN